MEGRTDGRTDGIRELDLDRFQYNIAYACRKDGKTEGRKEGEVGRGEGRREGRKGGRTDEEVGREEGKEGRKGEKCDSLTCDVQAGVCSVS